ncbi:MAG: SDR family NAD(P)-dependent oxidoreductase [Candidatus Lambdaproteobacteria bacterium]|nr:SDR family NAD(P)-dependent oxidoreductase [Candidatus Lambdaproteobacteria bacterium]
MKDFNDKVAVVTGAASGIGKALALDFAQRGMRVVLADIEQGPLAQAGAEVGALGAEHLELVCDVSRLADVQALADAAWRRFGKVHVLCNNAGVGMRGAIQALSLAQWQWVLGVNLWGVIHGVEAFVPRMISQQEGGHVVNTASIAGLVAVAGLGPYQTSKFAVVGLSESLARDLRPHGIGVSVLCPLGVDTNVWNSTRHLPDALRAHTQDIDRAQAAGTFRTPQEVSALVLRAIAAEQLYVFTHPEIGPLVDRRFEHIRAAYP